MTDVIHIHWSGPISPDEAHELTGPYDYGVNQFCSFSPERRQNNPAFGLLIQENSLV